MNLNEGAMFASEMETELGETGLFAAYSLLLDAMYGGSSNRDAITGWKTASSYVPYSQFSDSSSTYLDHSGTALSNVLNDGLFHCGNLASADSALQADQPDSLGIYGYLFVQPPVFNLAPTVDACVPAAGNVCHTFELPYVFNTLGYAASQPGSGQPSQADSALARQMAAAWTSFAKNPAAPPASGWQPYTPNGALYVWGGSNGGTMLQGWSTARNCTGLWYTLPPLAN
jgi:carboxylesterase type B